MATGLRLNVARANKRQASEVLLHMGCQSAPGRAAAAIRRSAYGQAAPPELQCRLQQRQEKLGRARDDRTVCPDDNWPLNELGIPHHRDELVRRRIASPSSWYRGSVVRISARGSVSPSNARTRRISARAADRRGRARAAPGHHGRPATPPRPGISNSAGCTRPSHPHQPRHHRTGTRPRRITRQHRP